MVSLEHYTEDFKNSLLSLIDDYENEENELKRLDSRIIKELSSIISDTTNFSVPFIPSRYPKYNKNKSLNTFNFTIPTAFEFEFDSYSKETFISSSLETKLPYIIFKIPNTNNRLDSFSKLIGDEIEGDLIFMVRKVSGRWELPLKGISVTESKITDVIIFKAIHFEMEVQKSKELLSEANMYNKELLSGKVEDFSVICFNNKENLFSSKRGLLIAESFMDKINKDKSEDSQKSINENKNGLFYLNTLYDFSIRF